MSSESGKLQLKVNPKGDRDYFPASEIDKFDRKKKERQWSKRPSWLKSIEDLRNKAVKKKQLLWGLKT